MNKNDGALSPFDEARAAWRPRVDLPHNLFEILFRRHMGRGLNFEFYEECEEEAVRAASRLTQHIATLAHTQEPLNRAAIAQSFPRDQLFNQDLSRLATKPLTVANNPAMRAWTGLVFTAALEPHLPKNFWCSTDALAECFRTAITDAREPGSYFFASELLAYQRMQMLNASLPRIAVCLAQEQKFALSLLTNALFSGQHAQMSYLRNSARREAEAHMNAPGVIPFKPR